MSEEWLRGETVRLRALEPEDLELLYRWENNPVWWDVGNTLAPYSRYLLKQYIAESHRDIFELKQQRFMVDYLPEGMATVGMVDLYDFDPHHRRAGVGILVDPAYQRRGIGREALDVLMQYAFAFLKLHQLYVHVSVQNEASSRLFSRCGFKTTGRLTDWLQNQTGYMDVYVMQRVCNQENMD